MSSEEQVYTDLTNHAGLTALVGTRIYPMLMPQDSALPTVVYELYSGERMNTLSDAGGSGVERNLYDVIAWGESLSDAVSAAEQVRLAMKAASVTYVYISKDSVFDVETKLYGIRQIFAQWFRA